MWTFNRFILKQVFTLSFVICLHIQWTVWVEKCNYENCIRKNIVRFITSFAVLEISLFGRYMVSGNTVCQKWKISAKKNISKIKKLFRLKIILFFYVNHVWIFDFSHFETFYEQCEGYRMETHSKSKAHM